jgi:hypothetical protein
MKHRVIGYSAGALAAVLFLAPAAQAQDTAPRLQDLVGARSGSGEGVLKKRGYTFVRGEKSGHDSYTGKTYFYVSDLGAAEMEVKHFHGQ